MSRLPRSVTSATSIVALAAAVALGGWEAERVANRGGLGQRRAEPARVATAHRAAASTFQDRLPVAGARLADAEESPSPVAQALSGTAAGASATDGQPEQGRAAAERLAEKMQRLVRDLEYNAGLPEPPQQVVVAPPPAWTPAASAAGAPPVIEEVAPSHAPVAGGTTVTIRGKNLRPSQIMFGSEPARIVSASAEAVTVVAPPARAGQVAIALTNGDGTYDITRAPFSYQ
jgi:hypothetical protein